MSEEFQKIARQEIQSELESLGHILLECSTDEKIHAESNEMEKHMHNIKGLAPMMGFENLGELARVSDAILKHIIINGELNGSHKIISEAIQKMKQIFSQNENFDTVDFASKARVTFPKISGIWLPPVVIYENTTYEVDSMVRVMISDDSDAIRMVLKDILKIGHHELVCEVTNGIDTVQEYAKVKPDVLLLDLAMPKKDGISALQEILASDPSAKIIMITASDNQYTIKNCMANGASAYILKPFNFEDVLKTITDVSRL